MYEYENENEDLAIDGTSLATQWELESQACGRCSPVIFPICQCSGEADMPAHDVLRAQEPWFVEFRGV